MVVVNDYLYNYYMAIHACMTQMITLFKKKECNMQTLRIKQNINAIIVCADIPGVISTRNFTGW